MSRSRKKNQIIKDSSNSKGKKLASRRARRTTKIQVAKGEEVIKSAKEITNQYDVCDYKFVVDKAKK